ncbi:MAG: kdpA [Actinomycetia bacterium]|nr:kdpA [Actinomycetes bacterium]
MTGANWLQLIVLVVFLVAITPPLGSYLAAVFGGGKAPGDRVFAPVERLLYRVGGIDAEREQRWNVYAYSLLAFSLVSVLGLYLMQRVQGWLPINPTNVHAVHPAVAWNTAVSFTTNTDWQSYSGESTMSHFTQLAGLTVQNFVCAAVGLAVAVALVRGLTRRASSTIGNFWSDLTRGVVRVLIPLALVFALVFVARGMVQSLNGFHTIRTLENAAGRVPAGPVASQEAVKEIGTNGGGFWNANSMHPFENPDGFTNLLEILLLLAIPFALTYAFGKMAKDQKQGWVVFSAMFALWLAAVLVTSFAETGGNKKLDPLRVSQTSQQGTSIAGNMEGKEVRFGTAGCGIFAPSTTGTSTGAVDCAHDSLTPLGGGVPLANMMLGEVSPGGVGAGLYGMLIFVLTAVFIAGLMVGRTPEYLGKRIQAGEVKLVVLYILFVPLVVLGFAGASVIMHTSASARLNPGAHGLSEIVYAFTSAGNNNGSAFAGITVTSNWYQTTLGLCMLVGRFFLMVPALAIAGSLARKKTVAASAGTFPTGTPLFAALLTGVVVIVVGLTYFPALALGPIVEHLSL